MTGHQQEQLVPVNLARDRVRHGLHAQVLKLAFQIRDGLAAIEIKLLNALRYRWHLAGWTRALRRDLLPRAVLRIGDDRLIESAIRE